MTMQELMEQRKQAECDLRIAEDRLAVINEAINEYLTDAVSKIRELQGKQFGAVNLMADGYKVTHTIPKKVEWDQKKMLDLYDAIAEAGDNPRNYMKMKLEVGEREYESFISDVKALFADCRTVKPGKPTFKFEEVQGA